ncbi:MAG: PaaI family thioesterase [Eggerthellaceae bacterium]
MRSRNAAMDKLQGLPMAACSLWTDNERSVLAYILEVAMVDAALIEKMKCNIPSSRGLGITLRILEVKSVHVHFTMDIPASLGNYRGGIHGGTGYFIGEIGCGFATYSFGVNNVCNSATVNFFKAVPCCKADVETEPLHKGRSTAVIRVTTREAATGKMLFQSTHNMFLLGPLKDDE